MLFERYNLSCRYRAWVCATGILLLSAGAQAQISLVHATPCGPQTFPTQSCTIPPTGSGNLLVVGWASNNGGGGTLISGITDNVGNVYLEAPNARSVDANPNTGVDFWYAKNSLAGAVALTITPSPSGTSGTVLIWEIAGADTTAPLDQTGVLDSQALSATPTGAPVIASADEVIISIADVQGSITGVAAGSPFASDSTANGDGWAHLITASAGTYTPQWVNNSSGSYCSSTVSFKASSSGGGGSSGPCDLNKDGTVNVVDVQLATNMDLGLLTCTADIDGAGVCNPTVVQRVVNAALGSACVVTHSVSLAWTASTSAVTGYNVYRGTNTGGPYTKLNSSPVATTAYTDSNVQSGQTYYYVTTAVSSSNNESAYSNEAQAIVPTP